MAVAVSCHEGRVCVCTRVQQEVRRPASTCLATTTRCPLTAREDSRPRQCPGRAIFIICGHWLHKINGNILKIHTDLESALENTDLN